MLGNKLSFPLMPFKIYDALSLSTLENVFLQSELPSWVTEVLSYIKPALLNRYKRKYWISFNNHFRLTLDDELSYFGFSSINNSFYEKYESDELILELKYKRRFDDLAPEVSNKIPFRLTKSSKYVNGIESLYPSLV